MVVGLAPSQPESEREVLTPRGIAANCTINNMYEPGFSMINSFNICKFIDKMC
jgi:hypothetical protein